MPFLGHPVYRTTLSNLTRATVVIMIMMKIRCYNEFCFIGEATQSTQNIRKPLGGRDSAPNRCIRGSSQRSSRLPNWCGGAGCPPRLSALRASDGAAFRVPPTLALPLAFAVYLLPRSGLYIKVIGSRSRSHDKNRVIRA